MEAKNQQILYEMHATSIAFESLIRLWVSLCENCVVMAKPQAIGMYQCCHTQPQCPFRMTLALSWRCNAPHHAVQRNTTVPCHTTLPHNIHSELHDVGGMAWCGAVVCGAVCGMWVLSAVWCDMAWHGTVRCSAVWCGVVWYCVV